MGILRRSGQFEWDEELRRISKRIPVDVILTHPIYEIVGRVADEMGVRAYAVGGVVRDYFLQRHCTDIDIVCVGDGIALAQAAAEAVGHHTEVHVFKNFGTASFRYSHGGEDWQIEFVGARKESYRSDSRKPAVTDGTLEDDQNRRDFTINAMAVSINADSFGQLLDPFGGIQDLDRGVIRTPLDPKITFSDDPLRMMRAIRFASQLGFTIAENTFNAIKENAGRIKIVSPERVTTELNKIILSPVPSVGFRLLMDAGLLELIMPDVAQLKGVESVGQRAHKDNFFHTLKVLDNVAAKSDNLWLRWAALLHDVGKPACKRYNEQSGWTFHGHEAMGAKMVKRIFKQLRLPLDMKLKYVEKLVLLHMRPIVLAEEVVTDSAVCRLLFEAGDDVEALMTLCEADITSRNEAKVRRHLENFQLVRRKLKELEEKDHIRNFQPPVSGSDIMQVFGLKPCSEIGTIKDAIKDAILDGRIPNERAAAWQMMLEEGEKLGLKPLKE